MRNLLRHLEVSVRSGRRDAARLPGRARLVEPASDEDELARWLVAGKYQPGYGGDLSRWRCSALPVAVDLAAPATDAAGRRRYATGHGRTPMRPDGRAGQ